MIFPLVYLTIAILVGGVVRYADPLDDPLTPVALGLVWPIVIPVFILIGATKLVANTLDKVLK